VFEPTPEWATWCVTVAELPEGDPFDDGPGLFDINAILETLMGTFHTDPQVRATQRRIDDAGDLGPYLVEAMRRVSVHPRETPIALRFLDADTAELNLVVNLSGQRTPLGGRVARDGMNWLVARETVLEVLRLAGTSPPSV
jgi:hypothetical protein